MGGSPRCLCRHTPGDEVTAKRDRLLLALNFGGTKDESVVGRRGRQRFGRDVTFRRPPGAKVRLARRVAELMVDDMQLFTVDIGIEKQVGGDKTHELRLHRQNTTS